MEELLLEHKKWLDSAGQNGAQLILENEDMRNANIDGTILHEAKLLECDFSKKSISKVDFENSVMCSSTFNCCLINDCNFRRTDLQYTEFKKAIISNTNFAKADLYETNFEIATITNSKLINASLYLSNFSNVKLENIDFSGAVFEETVLAGTEFKNILNIDDAIIKSINIGTVDNPNIIVGEEAKKWIYNKLQT